MTETDTAPKPDPIRGLRGTELRHAIMERIEAEYAAATKRAEEHTDHYVVPDTDDERAGHWDQGVWGRFSPADAIRLGLLDPDVPIEDSGSHYPGGSIVALESVDFEALASSDEPVCRTAMCFAGHAVVAVGDKPIFGTSSSAVGHTLSDLTEHYELFMDKVMPIDGGYLGKATSVRERAAELLGLGYGESAILFNAANSLEDLRELNTRLDNGKTIEKCSDCEEFEDECECVTDCDECGYSEDNCSCCSTCLRDTEVDSDSGGCECDDD
ncbi:hypothetical protein SEA_EVAA_71 [Gordonia phage Evaa]|nr:hypothetical protein SEA_EVAA_71 [Gordonia phage Evaa]